MIIIGFEIFDNLINNFKNFSLDLSYIRYKKLVLSFVQLGLTFIMEPTVNMIKTMADVLFKSSQIENIIVFDKLLKLLLSCLSFSFNIGYIDFENEWDQKEASSISV